MTLPGAESSAPLAIPTDERARRRVVVERSIDRCRQLRHDALGQDFAQFDPPLVKGVDVPDDALDERAVFIQRHQRAERVRGELVGQDRARRSVARKRPVWH